MHRSIPIIGTDIGIRLDEVDELDQNGPIEFDNPVYHEAGEKSSVVGPENVLHFPASPKRSKKSSPQPASPEADQTPVVPPRANQKVAEPSSTSSSTPSSSRSPSVDRKQTACQNVDAGQQSTVVTVQKAGPPLLVPRTNKTNQAAAATNPAAAAANSGQSTCVSQASDQSSPTRSANLVGSATMPANACAKQKSPKHLPLPSHSPMHVSASGALAPANESFRAKKTGGPRQLYVIRHGERIDFTFGKDWIRNSFDSGGNYIRYDLNMPKSLPKRKGGPKDYERDSPLTTQGHFQATLVGNALKDVDVPISHVYASPSLRCIQTASDILDGLGIQRPIHVEPGLFEWLGWYRSGMPEFMSTPELVEAGFNIATAYEPILPTSRYNREEKAEQYYDRCHDVTKQILQRHEEEGGNVLLVGHAASLDVCTRQLVGHPARGHVDFHKLLHKVPYCAVAVAQEGVHVREAWYIIEPPILPFAHTNNPKYNWTILTTPMHS